MNSSRKKEKRSRTSSSDANTSFVSNVASRMTGLLPSALTSWFSSPSSPSANGSVQAVEDSSDDDELTSPASTQPPPKRLRLSRPDEYNHYDAGQTNCVSSNIDTTETRTTYSTIKYLPQRNSHRWEANNDSTSLLCTENSVRSENNKTLQSPSQQHSASVSTSSVPIKRKSLFDISHSQEQATWSTIRDSRDTRDPPNQPCFKPSLLGSTFYPGRTMYGGASQYAYHPNIRQRKELNVKANNNSSADNSMSHSARRIMDLLEHYSSPLNDSRRIPHYTRPSINIISNTSFDLSPPNTSKQNLSHKTRELHVPNIASILRIKQHSRLMDTTAAARQIMASHSSTADYSFYPSPQTQNDRDQCDKESRNKLTTKVKSRLTRPKRGEQCDLESELPAPLNLPSAVLQIDQSKLPKFSLEPPTTVITRPAITATLTRPIEKEPAVVTSTPVSSSNKFDTFNSASQFKFASPVKISTDLLVQPATSAGYTFGIPEPVIHISEDKDKKYAAPKPTEHNVSKDWKCHCWVSNKPEVKTCVSCGAKNQTSDSIKVNSEIFEPIAKKNYGWKCGGCWVNNDADTMQCVCCGYKKPDASTTVATAVATTVATSDVDEQWKCNDCWIQNKSDVAQCVACGGARSGSKVQPKPADSFKIILKKQSNKWECPNCLVSNDSEKTKCACCETEKPGSTTAAAKSTFNFGTSSTAFKFGILNAQANDTASPVEIKATLEPKKNEESETNNNVISKTPTFTFGLPAKKTEDKPDGIFVDTYKTAGTTNFSFGIPKLSSNVETLVPASSVLTAITPLKSNNEDKEKTSQDLPQAHLNGMKSPETTKSFANFFAPPSSLQVQENKSSIASPSSAENKTEQIVSSTAVTTIAPAPTFTFGGVNLGGSLFSASAAASAASSSTVFGAPVTTGATLFQNMEPAMNTLPTFNVDPAISSTPASNSTAASLFSFGSNKQSTAANADQFKFSFSFGTNTKTENSIFQPPQTTTEDNSSANKFSIPNAFGSVNNNAVTNSLGVVNGLPAATSSGSSATATTVQASNALPSGSGLFGSATPKESIWLASGTTPGGLFSASVPSSTPQKPTFSFGSTFNTGAPPTQSTPTFDAISVHPTSAFGVNNEVTPTFGVSTQPTPTFGTNTQATPAFGTNSQPTPAFGAATQSATAFGTLAQSTPTFGAATQPAPAFGSQTTSVFGSGAQSPPAFGSSTTAFGSGSPLAFGTNAQTPSFGGPQQTSANPFGMAAVNGASQASQFGTGAGSTSAPGMFQASSMGAPAGGLFGTATAPAPSFGSPTASQPRFEAPSQTSTPFNFTPQPGPVFGFGQQTQQPQGAGIYSFGGGSAGGSAGSSASMGGGMQFNMGSGASVQARRVRKAVRRTNNLRQ